MRVTRRGQGAAVAGLFLVALGVLLDHPLPLLGGAVVGAWLLATAFRFVRQLDALLDGMTVDQRTDRDGVVTDRDIAVTLETAVARPSALHLVVESRPPASTSVGEEGIRTVAIDVGQERAETTYLASWPHAGAVAFEPPRTTATDPLGLFEQSFAAGPAPRVTVSPRRPRDVHVGAGGQPVAAAYGDHRAGRSGAGLEPAELREYVPGDAADRIDWKATARLAEPFVREFEVETDRRTVLVLDHRAPTGVGPDGETALDYLREVAIAYVETARAFDDPLGCYTVGEAGLTGRWLPEVDRHQSARIRRHLGTLEPMAAAGDGPPGASDPARARRVADRLAADGGGPFGETLVPYFDHAAAYVRRLAGEPLYEAVRDVRGTLSGSVWTVVLADDSDPAGLRQAVSVASRGAGRVVVYLAPSVLFEPGGLADLEAAYDRYVAFEELRRELARPDGVDAFEVAPGDRIEAVLSAGRSRRRANPSAGGAR